jgi:deoxycytidylate deaminase
MRNNEDNHIPCDNILREIGNCGIFYIECHDPEDEESDIKPGEVAISNDFCTEDPLYLTVGELRELGQQLMLLADKVEKGG